jgi:hypothetical protein
MQTATIDAVGTSGYALRIEFVRHGDRYGHTIFVVDPSGCAAPVLESVEGTASNAWPPSPPLQSLSIEELAPGRRAALLVGMAGRSHWSASIEPIAGEAAAMFDIACRADAAGSLGSQYRLLASVRRVAVTAAMGCEAKLDRPLGRWLIRAPFDAAGTKRWKYRVALAG